MFWSSAFSKEEAGVARFWLVEIITSKTKEIMLFFLAMKQRWLFFLISSVMPFSHFNLGPGKGTRRNITITLLCWTGHYFEKHIQFVLDILSISRLISTAVIVIIGPPRYRRFGVILLFLIFSLRVECVKKRMDIWWQMEAGDSFNWHWISKKAKDTRTYFFIYTKKFPGVFWRRLSVVILEHFSLNSPKKIKKYS